MNEHQSDSLIEQVIDGIASPSAWDEVERRLRESEEFAQQYITAMQVESLLQSSFADAAETAAAELRLAQHVPPVEAPAIETRSHVALFSRMIQYRWHPTPLSLAVAALVIGLLIATMAFMAPPFYRAIVKRGDDAPGHNPYEIAAEVAGLYEALWAPGELSVFKGAHLTAGRELELESGYVQLAFRDGANVVLEGPALLRVVSSAAMELDNGKLTARMPQGAQGFVVATPTARIVDLGTEFGVHATRDGTTSIHVLDGKVEVFSGESIKQRIVIAGAAVAVSRTGEIEPAKFDAIVFTREMPQRHWTELTFRIVNPIPRSGSDVPQAYGDHVRGAGTIDEAPRYLYGGGGNYTPGVAVDYAAGNSAKYLTWHTGDWAGGVGFLRSDGRAEHSEPYYDTRFTPQPNASVRIISFVLDDWDGDGEGHTVDWGLYADAVVPANLIAEGKDVLVASDQELVVRTEMTTPHAGPVILRIQHRVGKGNYLAIDNIRFEQCDRSPNTAL